jgi:hypothetical protein
MPPACSDELDTGCANGADAAQFADDRVPAGGAPWVALM